MRRIDMRTWPRRQHFEFFNTFDNPYFGMCANVDLSKFYPFMKQHGYSNNIGIIYLIARTANTIPEFRFASSRGRSGRARGCPPGINHFIHRKPV